MGGGVVGGAGVVGGVGAVAEVNVRVVTTLVAAILRIMALPVSATKRLPLASIAKAWGWLKKASLPVPSLSPAIPGNPAIVVTVPAGVILRMVELPVSARYKLPVASTASPPG